MDSTHANQTYSPKPENAITDGISSNHLYDNYHTPHGEVGWICPVCGRGLAPSTSYCPCHMTNGITFISSGCTIKEVLDGATDCNTIPPEVYLHHFCNYRN